ncbi:MAG: hypothetical protein ACE5PT_12155 [Gemmatimonadales bacterium]
MRCVLLALSLPWLGGHAGRAQVIEATRVDRHGSFASPLLRECSGIAASRRHEGVLWAHNDSGDEPLLYATTLDGENLGSVRVTGGRAIDWEDIAAGPCPESTEPCLYIADTGDNLERRSTVTIYIVPEPARLPRDGGTNPTAPAHALVVTYPDGPHDVEALAVAGDGEISLFTKGGRSAIRRYRIAPLERLAESTVAVLTDTLAVPSPRRPLEWVTGAAYSPDGARIALRTYSRIVFLEIEPDGALRAAGPPCEIGFREPQGEAIDFLNDSTLVLASEDAWGRKGGIWTAVCPKETRGR